MNIDFWDKIPTWHNYIYYNWIDEVWQSSVDEPNRKGAAHDAYWWVANEPLTIPDELINISDTKQELNKKEFKLVFRRYENRD